MTPVQFPAIAAAMVVALTVLPAQAQMAVSTFGASDAQLCYREAADILSEDVRPCDLALQNGGMVVRDRIATLVNRGIVLNRAERFVEALADFNAALDLDDETPEALLNRGNSYYLMRRYDEAIVDYEAALGAGLTKAEIGWYNIGLALDAKNEPAKAREAYRKALDLNPDFGLAQKKLGLSAGSANKQ